MTTPFIPFSFPGLPRVRVLFTTAGTGNLSLSAAASNQEKDAVISAKQAFKERFAIKEWTEVHQVHGDDMTEAPEHFDIGAPPPICADGLYTNRKDHALTIRTADCQPILFAHEKGSFIAAIHAGWRGNAMNFPGSAVKRLCRIYDVAPSELMAVRGPSLGPGAAEFVNFDREWPPAFRPWFNEKDRTMDLWRVTRCQLEDAGLTPGNIFSLDLCTYSLPGYFFSHRQKHTGRQAAVIWTATEQ